MSSDKKDDPFAKYRDSEGRVLRRWGHLEVTDEQRDIVQKRMDAWRVFQQTGDKSLLIELGIHPPDTGQGQKT